MRIIFWVMAFILVGTMLFVLNSLPAESSKGDLQPIPKPTYTYHKSMCA